MPNSAFQEWTLSWNCLSSSFLQTLLRTIWETVLISSKKGPSLMFPKRSLTWVQFQRPTRSTTLSDRSPVQDIAFHPGAFPLREETQMGEPLAWWKELNVHHKEKSSRTGWLAWTIKGSEETTVTLFNYLKVFSVKRDWTCLHSPKRSSSMN